MRSNGRVALRADRLRAGAVESLPLSQAAQARSHQVAIAVKPALPFSAGLPVPHPIHGGDVQIAGHHLQTDRRERNEDERCQDNNQQDSHQGSFEVAGASRQQAHQTRRLQPQRLLELRNVRERRNGRPIRDNTDAENDSKSDQQCETRRPAVHLVLIDIRHGIAPVKTRNLRLARFAVRGARDPLGAFNLVLSVSFGRTRRRACQRTGIGPIGSRSLDNKPVFALVNVMPVHSYKLERAMDFLKNQHGLGFTRLHAHIVEEDGSFTVRVRMLNHLRVEQSYWGEEIAATFETASSMIGSLANQFAIPQSCISIKLVMRRFKDGTLH
jgi:hypothetical protein